MAQVTGSNTNNIICRSPSFPVYLFHSFFLFAIISYAVAFVNQNHIDAHWYGNVANIIIDRIESIIFFLKKI
jgi:hypothetical protein